MSVYPHRTIEDRQKNMAGGEFWTEVETEPGIVRRRFVLARPWIEERTDCFCCSCDEESFGDPACRNHGWAARRPCDVHGMSGLPWDDNGEMPESVQAVWRKRRGVAEERA